MRPAGHYLCNQLANAINAEMPNNGFFEPPQKSHLGSTSYKKNVFFRAFPEKGGGGGETPARIF